MAKLQFGDTGACPAMYPVQESGNKKYALLDRVKDDSNNEIGTVSGFFTDANDVEYAVVCLDAQYRKSNESGEQLINSAGYITNLGTYTSQDLYRTKKSSTYNTQAVLDYCTANGYSSNGCTYCRSLSFTIDGTTYYGQYPNIIELLDMVKITPELNRLDITASTYSNKIFNNKSLQSSNEGSDYNMWTITYDGEIRNQSFKWWESGMLVPVLEIPLS